MSLVRDERPFFLEVDLTDVRFIDVYTLVTLLTMLSQVSSVPGWDTRLVLPSHPNPLTYMARMRFFQHLPENVELVGTPPTVNEWTSALVELQPISLNPTTGISAIDNLCNFIHPQDLQHRRDRRSGGSHFLVSLLRTGHDSPRARLRPR